MILNKAASRWGPNATIIRIPVPTMLSEVSVASLYVPPFLIYLGVAVLAYRLFERALRRGLDWTLHPALARFFVSLIIVSALVVHC